MKNEAEKYSESSRRPISDDQFEIKPLQKIEQRENLTEECQYNFKPIFQSSSTSELVGCPSRQFDSWQKRNQLGLINSPFRRSNQSVCSFESGNSNAQIERSKFASKSAPMKSSVFALSCLPTSPILAISGASRSLLQPITILLVITWCLTVLVGQRSKVEGVEVFSSTAHVRKLVESERQLLQSLERYMTYERARLDLITGYINEIQNKTKDPAHVAVDHPLNAFNIIQRFSKIWSLAWGYAQDFRAFEALREVILKVEPDCPTVNDYAGAKTAIIRLQQTYGLNLEQLAHGRIFNHSTTPLSQETLFEIANQAIENWDGEAAVEWMTCTMNHSIEPTVAKDQLHSAMGRAVALTGDHLAALDHVRKAVEISPNETGHLLNLLPNQTSSKPYYKRQPNMWPVYTRLCRRGISQPEPLLDAEQTVDETPSARDLHCFYRRASRDPLRTYKIEELSLMPEVFIVHEMITDAESEALINSALGRIQRAMVGKSVNESTVSESRVGKVAWLKHGEPLMRKLNSRISDVTLLNVNEYSSEELQVGNYGMGGHYEAHMDALEPRLKEFNVSLKNDRIATLMFYLNAVEEGGATIFPKINLGTRPIKNAAIVWYNYKRNGFIDMNTLHAGCPVLIGEKWVANKWIHEWGQEFIRPCDLDPNI